MKPLKMALYKTETYVGVDEGIIKVKVKCISLVFVNSESRVIV
jgi:hypothetical protein